MYYKKYNIYQYKKKDQKKFNRINIKLQEQILTTMVL